MKKILYFLNCIVLIIGVSYQVQSQIISNFAGNGTVGYSGNGGAAVSAQIDSPSCLAMDLAGNIYIGDQRNNTVRKVDPSGIITTVAGNGNAGYSGDGGPAISAKLNLNWGMTADGAGNIYICDQANQRVRKVSTSGVITTIAGNGTEGFSGDGGPALSATLRYPMGVAVDGVGNVYFSDSYNYCIRKVNTSGIISLVAGIPGSAGYSGDGGPATAARIDFVWGLATDAAGNLYLCDGNNNRVRMVDLSGTIKTIAGTGVAGYDFDNVPATAAKLNKPICAYVSADGKIYISDVNNNRVRRVGPDGIITTIAGTGLGSYNGEGIPATSAHLHHPIGVIADADESIYVTDLLNVRVRKIVNVLSFIAGDNEHIDVCQNSGPVPINDILSVRDVYVGLTDNWALLTPPANGSVVASFSATSTGGVVVPSGLSYTPYSGYVGPDSFTVKVSNSLSSDLIVIYVTVDPLLIPGPIMGAAEVCVGDTMLLSNTISGGLWSSLKGNVQLFPSLSSCVVKGLFAGVDTIRYQVANACGNAYVNRAVTINPLPDVGVISGPSAICLGGTGNYIATVPGGLWYTSNLNGSILPKTASSAELTGLIEGSTTVQYKINNVWCSAVAIKQVAIEVFPAAGNIVGPSNLCVGKQIMLADSVQGGVWSSEPGNVTIVFGLVTGLSPGVETIKYSVTNSCGTDVAIRSILVNPVPAQPVVTLEQGVLSATKGYSSYQWKLNTVELPGANADTLYADLPGFYQVEVTNGEGCPVGSSVFDYNGCEPDDIVLYPNPTRNVINIVWCKKVTARLMAADGKTIGVAENTNIVDLSVVPAGVYMLSLFDNNGHKIRTSKVVKLW
jgi:hypothetical protein